MELRASLLRYPLGSCCSAIHTPDRWAERPARIPFQGGPIGSGREFLDDFFSVNDGHVVFGSEQADRYVRGFRGELGIDRLADPDAVNARLGDGLLTSVVRP